MRGLKPKNEYGYETLRKVASFTDAWIETKMTKKQFLEAHVASFTDAWIETDGKKPFADLFESHLLQMRGLKLRSPQA